MGVKKENDGRYSVGMGVQNGNEYKGSQGWRDIFIQLTADGATEDSIEKLEFLRDYAIYHSGEGNPVMPPSVNVWISNNGTTTAVEADDIAYTDGVYTICGIKCSGDSWDFSNAGQGGGGGGLPAYTTADAGKVLTVGERTEAVVVVPEQTVTTDENGEAPLAGVDFSRLTDGDTVTAEMTEFGTVMTVYHSSGSRGEGLYINNLLVLSATTLLSRPSATVTISAFASLVTSVAPVWQTSDEVYLVHFDAETMTIVEDIDDVYSAFARMPVYLIAPDGSGVIHISYRDGSNLFGYLMDVQVGIGTTPSVLSINRIMISDTGSLSSQRFTVNVTIAE